MLLEHKRPNPIAVLRAQRQHTLALDALDAHPIRAESDHIAHTGALELRQHPIDAVHIQAQRVLDPIVGVGTATRRRPHLHQPRPYGARRRLNPDRPSCNAVRPLQELVARQARRSLGRGRPPGEDGISQEQTVERPQGGRSDQTSRTETHERSLNLRSARRIRSNPRPAQPARQAADRPPGSSRGWSPAPASLSAASAPWLTSCKPAARLLAHPHQTRRNPVATETVGKDDMELLAPAAPRLLLRPSESERLTVLSRRAWASSDPVVRRRFGTLPRRPTKHACTGLGRYRRDWWTESHG